MENHNSLSSESNDTSKIPYSKINTQEDTFLELKQIKSSQSTSESTNSNDFENDNDIENDNDDENINDDYRNGNKLNKKQGQGVLNRKLSKYFYMRIGNTYTFFGDKDGSPLIVIGPHWPMYVCFCSFVVIGLLSFFYYFWSHIGIFIKISGIFVLLSFFISYTMTFLVNPGIPKYDENAILGQPREKYRFCNLCKIYVNMDENTGHCFDCNVCVEGYDHHCPWTGKCIGKNNLKYFYAFLMSILFVFAYFVLAMTQAQNDAFTSKRKKRKRSSN